jgi:beta-galactosidase
MYEIVSLIPIEKSHSADVRSQPLAFWSVAMSQRQKIGCYVLGAATVLAWVVGAHADPARTTLNFDSDWRFYKGEQPAPAPAQPLSGNYAPIDPASFAMKDDTWRKVDLPHDWSIEGPFSETAPTNAAGGFLPAGVAWYRKTFSVPAEAKGKRVFVEFDGAMANSEVYINKGMLGSRPNGYVPFRYDMTDYINWGGPNLLAVRTDTSRQPASRWYSGAGIYRHTRLLIENPVHLEWGQRLSPRRK